MITNKYIQNIIVFNGGIHFPKKYTLKIVKIRFFWNTIYLIRF